MNIKPVTVFKEGRYTIHYEDYTSYGYQYVRTIYTITDKITQTSITISGPGVFNFNVGSEQDRYNKLEYKYQTEQYLTKLKSILSCSIEDLATHVNDPDDLDKLVYWRYSL
jgi:hypothetical protein